MLPDARGCVHIWWRTRATTGRTRAFGCLSTTTMPATTRTRTGDLRTAAALTPSGRAVEGQRCWQAARMQLYAQHNTFPRRAPPCTLPSTALPIPWKRARLYDSRTQTDMHMWMAGAVIKQAAVLTVTCVCAFSLTYLHSVRCEGISLLLSYASLPYTTHHYTCASHTTSVPSSY